MSSAAPHACGPADAGSGDAPSSVTAAGIPLVGERVIARCDDRSLVRGIVTRVLVGRHLIIRLQSGQHVGRTW